MSDTYIPTALRRQITERAQNRCEYCLMGQGDRPIDFAIDHIIVEKHGGETGEHNLCLSCYWCNSYKGSDLSSVDWTAGGQIIPLFNPRQQSWSDHFRLESARIQPLTATGRATVYLRRLNSEERLEERELLLALGSYPCSLFGE